MYSSTVVQGHVHPGDDGDVVVLDRRRDENLVPALLIHHHLVKDGASQAQAEAGEQQRVSHAHTCMQGIGRLFILKVGKVKFCTILYLVSVGW